MIKNQKNYIIYCGLVILLAAALRFYNLGDTCLWHDEAVNANNVVGTFSQMFENTRKNNSAPIMMPILLWVIQDQISNPWVARLFPALFGIAAVAVCLMFPLAGVSKKVAGISGAVMAFSWSQITYSQEVREYIFGVLISSLLLLFFLRVNQKEFKTMNFIVFFVLIIIAPFISYGLIFLCMGMVAVFCVADILKYKYVRWQPVVLCLLFAVALRLSYLFTAIYQTGIAGCWHLELFYPPDSLFDQIAWLVNSLVEFVDFNTGLSGSAFILVLYGACLMSARTDYKINRESAIKLIVDSRFLLVILIFIVLSLSFLQKYPFGGARQLLFAAPLVVLVFSTGLVKILKFTGENKSPQGLLFPVLFAIIVFSFPKYSMVYSDTMDIKLPLSLIPEKIPSESIFIDAYASPSVKYHYPLKNFSLCRAHADDIRKVSEQINEMPGTERIAFLFDRTDSQIQQIKYELEKYNQSVEIMKRFKEGHPRQSVILHMKSKN